MSETRGEYRPTPTLPNPDGLEREKSAEAAAVNELLRLFTPAQLAAICTQVRAIRDSGYGEVTIRVDGDRVYLRPTVSISLGKVRE